MHGTCLIIPFTHVNAHQCCCSCCWCVIYSNDNGIPRNQYTIKILDIPFSVMFIMPNNFLWFRLCCRYDFPSYVLSCLLTFSLDFHLNGILDWHLSTWRIQRAQHHATYKNCRAYRTSNPINIQNQFLSHPQIWQNNMRKTWVKHCPTNDVKWLFQSTLETIWVPAFGAQANIWIWFDDLF